LIIFSSEDFPYFIYNFEFDNSDEFSRFESFENYFIDEFIEFIPFDNSFILNRSENYRSII
jgi:hypothetical protein